MVMKFTKLYRFLSSGVTRTSTHRRLIHTSFPVFNIAGMPSPPGFSRLVDKEDNEKASAWLARFRALDKKIPKELVELSFSRSSGPGGQNVNKVNTKATARCSVDQSWIPGWAFLGLQEDPHFVEATQSLLVTSTVHRSQSQNVEECLRKLYSIILSAASRPIRKAPSEEQTKKVEGLIKAEQARRKQDTMKRSSVKQGRSAKGGRHDF